MAKNEKSEAAEKIEKAAKAKKAGAPKNKESVFKRMGKGTAKFGKDFKGEVKKITWPGAKMVLKSTLVVIVAIVVIGVAIFAIDWCLSRGVDGLESLASKSSTSEVQDTDKKDDDKKADEADETADEADDEKADDEKADDEKADEKTEAADEDKDAQAAAE